MSHCRFSFGVSLLLFAFVAPHASASPDVNLVHAWSRTYDSGGDDRAWSIAADQSVVVTAVGRLEPLHRELILLQYSATGGLDWSEQSGQQLFDYHEAPLVIIDPFGDRIFTWTDNSPSTRSVVQKRDLTGAVLWTYERGCCTYPTAIDADADRIAVAFEFDVGPMAPEMGLLDHDGELVCGDHMYVGFPGFRMPAIQLIAGRPWMGASGGLLGDDYNGTITLFQYDETCERRGSTHVGLGGDATITDVITLDGYYAVTVGSIEVKGNSDVHLAAYKHDLGLPFWIRTVDMNGADDVANAAAADDDGNGIVVGTTTTASGSDVLIGRFDAWNAWWTSYDGFSGDDEGVDVAVAPDGRIAVLARVERGASETFEAVLLYGADGQLLGQARNRFVSTPSAMAVGEDGAIYTVGSNVAGDVVTSRYETGGPGSRPATVVAPLVLEGGRAAPSGSVRLTFALGEAGNVRASVYDVSGRLVRSLRDAIEDAGTHELDWDGRNEHGARVASGAYFVRVESGRHVATRRVLLVH